MRRGPRRLGAGALAAALLAMGACKDGPASPSPTGVRLGQEFTLAVGQSAAVEGTAVRVALRAVREDSRCPTDVQCVWEGDATVALDVTGGAPPAAAYDLHTSGRFPREVTHGPYRIALVRLDPTPRAGAAPGPADYRATLLVVR